MQRVTHSIFNKGVSTGRGTTVSMLTVIAIWSLSLGVNLPGLAVSPMLDSLKEIFGHVSEFEVQLLTVLPNVLIIPFVLLSGRLSMSTHKFAIVMTGLCIYLAAGVIYLFSESMTALILTSCLLGIGCGLLIPFSTGLVADVFAGSERMRQMGIISAIGNISLVAATFVVGLLASVDWHLPFLVYLIPAVSLLLAPWLKKVQNDSQKANLPAKPADYAQSVESVQSDQPVQATQTAQQVQSGHAKILGGFYLDKILWLSVVYFMFIFVVAGVTEYLPFIGINSEEAGTITSVLYLAMFVSGIGLSRLLCWFKGLTIHIAVVVMMAGIALLVFTGSLLLYIIGAILVGASLGAVQPIIYDKATDTVDSPSRATLALAIVLATNYAAVSLIPAITDGLRDLMHIHSDMFPFWLDGAILIALLAIGILRRGGFVFGIPAEYYGQEKPQ